MRVLLVSTDLELSVRRRTAALLAAFCALLHSAENETMTLNSVASEVSTSIAPNGPHVTHHPVPDLPVTNLFIGGQEMRVRGHVLRGPVMHDAPA